MLIPSPNVLFDPTRSILRLGREVPPRVGLCQVQVGPGAGARGLGGPHVRPRGEGPLQQAVAVEGHLAEDELTGDGELARYRIGADGGAQRDAGDVLRLPGIAEITLEREALDLDAQQLQLGDVTLVHPKAVDALDLVECLQIVRGELPGGLGGQKVGERLLHLRADLAAEVGQLQLADAARRLRALDPALALAARLDGLRDRDGVLLVHVRAPQLIGQVRRRRVRPQPGGDLVGFRRRVLALLGP